jgi:hypothetical protein
MALERLLCKYFPHTSEQHDRSFEHKLIFAGRYLFLLERVHIVRAPFASRGHDVVWLAGFCFIFMGFGGLTTYEAITAHSGLSLEDGLCRVGLVPYMAFEFMGVDTFISVALTGIFIWLLRPVLNSRANPNLFGVSVSQRRDSSQHSSLPRAVLSINSLLKHKKDRKSFQDIAKSMMWRNVIGSTLILLFTFANIIIFLKVKAVEQGHVIALVIMNDRKLRCLFILP